jgi:hypothetical protein
MAGVCLGSSHVAIQDFSAWAMAAAVLPSAVTTVHCGKIIATTDKITPMDKSIEDKCFIYYKK